MLYLIEKGLFNNLKPKTMDTKYLCPHCENALNVDKDIVLKAKNNSGRKGIVFLHTLLGNYKSRFNAEFTIMEGEKVKFYGSPPKVVDLF